MGDYEFNAATHDRAQKWKKEIEQRVEQSKLSRSGVLENDKYKESYGHFKDLTGTLAILDFSNYGRTHQVRGSHI
jgi:basic membrane lipoprotein Med (substrate-binding protein (PBP1-ABC) superfamily)